MVCSVLYLSGSVLTPTTGLSLLKTLLATSSIVPSPNKQKQKPPTQFQLLNLDFVKEQREWKTRKNLLFCGYYINRIYTGNDHISHILLMFYIYNELLSQADSFVVQMIPRMTKYSYLQQR